MHDLDDGAWHLQSALTRDADFIDYRAQVCTAADQLPVTSGYVERDWTENGRRCIAYRMDSPMAAIFPFVSARYAVRRDVWHGPDGDVAIEIDYHPGHEYNLDRMVAGVKDSLAYLTRTLAVPAQDPAHHRVPALSRATAASPSRSRTPCRSTRRSASRPGSTTAIPPTSTTRTS